ncbi:MAG: hypothetical protein H7Y32_21100 [Chloroflexales bacterium]|nr:hypothetical protein [Chloroflexales bacterium]
MSALFCRWGATCCALIAFCLLTGCGLRPLLADVSADHDVLRPGTSIGISYSVGQSARVSIFIEGGGQRYTLRDNEPRSPDTGAYTMRFDGTVPTADPLVPRRLLPNGTYTYRVQATADDGQRAEGGGQIRIEGANLALPRVENLAVSPATISPNGDAIADITEITYRLPISATVDIDIVAPDGTSFALVSRANEGPREWQHTWNGKRPDNALLPAGSYTVTVRAADLYGNVVLQQQTVALENAGQPKVEIISAVISPVRVMLGETITVTLRVKNTGSVPIRTYGPPSGYTYTTDQVYSSVEDARYKAKSGGFWRIGMDWDANGGGGARRYPFRWALSQKPPDQWASPGEEDLLLPGQEVEVVGHVTIVQQENKMGFYVGLIQDGVGFFQDRTARTIVEVSF